MSSPHEGVAPEGFQDTQVSQEDFFRLEVGGEAYLVEGACPHRKGRLRHGHVNARTSCITCPLHYSTFDLKTGRPLSGPSGEALRTVHLGAARPRSKETGPGGDRGGQGG